MRPRQEEICSIIQGQASPQSMGLLIRLALIVEALSPDKPPAECAAIALEADRVAQLAWFE